MVRSMKGLRSALGRHARKGPGCQQARTMAQHGYDSQLGPGTTWHPKFQSPIQDVAFQPSGIARSINLGVAGARLRAFRV